MQLLVDAGFHDFGGLPPQMFGKYYDNNTYHDKILKKSEESGLGLSICWKTKDLLQTLLRIDHRKANLFPIGPKNLSKIGRTEAFGKRWGW